MILSSHVDLGTATRVLAERPGWLGYLLKDRVGDVDEFVGTLRRVAAGGSALDPEVVSRLLASHRDDGPLQALTPRELEVLQLVAEGRSNKGDRRPPGRQRARRPEARHRDLRQVRPRGRRGRQPAHPRRPGVREALARGVPDPVPPHAGRLPVRAGGPMGRWMPLPRTQEHLPMQSLVVQNGPLTSTPAPRRSSPPAASSAATARATPPSMPCAASPSTSPQAA